MDGRDLHTETGRVNIRRRAHRSLLTGSPLEGPEPRPVLRQSYSEFFGLVGSSEEFGTHCFIY